MSEEIKELLFLLHNDRLTEAGKRKLEQEIERLKEELKYTIPIVEHNKTITKHLKEIERQKEVINGMIDNEEKYCLEIERLNNIINELEDLIVIKLQRDYHEHDYRINTGDLEEIYDKLQELKGSDK